MEEKSNVTIPAYKYAVLERNSEKLEILREAILNAMEKSKYAGNRFGAKVDEDSIVMTFAAVFPDAMYDWECRIQAAEKDREKEKTLPETFFAGAST